MSTEISGSSATQNQKLSQDSIDRLLAMFRLVSDEGSLERELAVTIAALPVIIARFDLSYKYLFVSPGVVEISGHEPEFYFGKSHSDIEKDYVLQARWRGMFDFVFRSKETRELEHYWVDKNGMARFFITKISPLITEKNDVNGFIAISTDHSDRERRLTNLQSEGVELKRADDRKNEYLATLAHELRGPLAPISSAVQLMKLSTDPAVIIKARGIIERQVTQMAGLIDDLMEIGRISSGKMVLSIFPVSVDTLVKSVVEATQPVLSAKQQPFKIIEIPPDLWVSADSMRLTQLLLNLLTNASKYSPIGSEVSLEVIGVDNRIEFRVKDRGIGLSKSSMEKIFEMFAQVHPSGRDSRGGLGIGLALAQQIAQMHQGKITVQSAGLSHGSTFVFEMPMGSKPTVETAVKDTSSGAFKPMKLLVVDDNVDGANGLADMLTAMGHIAVKTYDGTSAILLLENEAFDLAFLDLGLPDKTGIEVALTISKGGFGANVRLIALTGLSRERDRFVTRAAGFEEHLVKPIKFEDLVRLVGKTT